MPSPISLIINDQITWDEIWNEGYKIPWHDPQFSARMLAEHLCQDHDMASRRAETIAAQMEWMSQNVLPGSPGSVLDLGCGPGLYSTELCIRGHRYRGVDISPASIEYARGNAPAGTDCSFVLGDMRSAELDGPHDLACLIFGEFNVFAPRDARRILQRVATALAPGGRIMLEAQAFAAVQGVGLAMPTWYMAREGLFSPLPHICLIENHWNEELAVALQVFYVLDESGELIGRYRSTTQAWSDEQLMGLLAGAGFGQVTIHADWPGPGGNMVLLTGVKE